MFFYEVGSTTPKDVYLDANLTIPAANPVLLNADGRMPDTFLSGAYRTILIEPSTGEQWERDNVGSEFSDGFGSEWNNTVAYNIPNVVLFDGVYYLSEINNNINNQPGPNSSAWSLSYVNLAGTVIDYQNGNAPDSWISGKFGTDTTLGLGEVRVSGSLVDSALTLGGRIVINCDADTLTDDSIDFTVDIDTILATIGITGFGVDHYGIAHYTVKTGTAPGANYDFSYESLKLNTSSQGLDFFVGDITAVATPLNTTSRPFTIAEICFSIIIPDCQIS
jgi:hypothetical protein